MSEAVKSSARRGTTRGFIPTVEQAAVIDAPADEDVLVIAGAGSGKTTTMTHRIAALTERDHVSPERILGLTFTRKAAAELSTKIDDIILSRTSQNSHVSASSADSLDSSALAGLVMKPHISTYDAFFQSIVSQYGLLVGMDPRTQPLSDAGSIQIISDIIARNIDVLFSDALSEGDPKDGGDFGGDSPVNAGAVDPLVAEVRGLSQNIASSMIDESCSTMEEAIESIRSWDQKFLRTLQRLRPVGVPANEVCARPKAPSRTPAQARKLDMEQWMEKEWDEKIVPYQADVVDYLAAKIRRRELLLTIVEWYQEEKRRLGVAEFSDFTITALQLVMRFPSIGGYYRRRFSHVFLDEYQDTSTTQATLLAALFHPKDGSGHSAVTAVGDPYQSIYSWRGACPGAFRLFLQKFDVQGEPFKLLTSQRNPKIILDAANRLTEDFRTPDSSGSVPVDMREVPVDTLKPAEAASKRGMLPPALSVMGFQTREEEADAVACFARDAVSRWRDSGGQDGAGSRSPVAILCRSRAWMDDLAKALRSKDLTYAMVGNNPLMDRPDMSDMLALLRAAADHASSATLLRLLASPRMGMTVDDLKILSSAAGAANTDYQFLALREAGVVDASTASSPRERANVVRNLRDDVSLPTGVFLADFILSEDCDGALSSTTMSQQGRACVRRVAGMLRRVEDAARSSIADAIRMAAEVLDLDIDSAVACAVGDSGCRAVAASYADAVDVVLGQVDAFGRELPSGRRGTLSGFLSWLDAMTRDPDGPATDVEADVDVTLLTIHQAKGLQWPAVAVVGLADGLFPSSTGEKLSVTVEGDGQWSQDFVPRYRATSRCWLEIPSDVPAPVRADREILPRFPHKGSLHDIGDAQTLEREFSDSLNAENCNALNTGETFPSQCEEYGRLRHEDERRLAYVALTRTQGASLMTFSKQKSSHYGDATETEIARIDDKGHSGLISRAASNFWQEVHSFFAPRAEEGGLSLEKRVRGIISRESLDMPEGYRCPVGFALCGDRRAADGLLESVARSNVDLVRQSWLRESGDEDSLPWPRGLDRRMRDVLSMSARMVMGRSGDGPSSDASGTDNDGGNGSCGPLARRATTLIHGVTAEGRIRGGRTPSLLERVDRVRERANLSTTTIEKTLAAKGDANKAETMALSILRPVPLPPAMAANRGTLFHEWAAEFLDAWIEGEVDDRGAMVASIDSDQSLDSDERAWRHRLAQSPWSRRRPIAAELPIVVMVDDGSINGTIDAVFAGGIADERTKAEGSVPSTGDAGTADDVLTIVDWKTGRKPTAVEDVENRLVQLDIYRLLLSGQLGVPLENIQATLYYLSEKDPQSRAIPARNRTREEIVSLIREGRRLSEVRTEPTSIG